MQNRVTVCDQFLGQLRGLQAVNPLKLFEVVDGAFFHVSKRYSREAKQLHGQPFLARHASIKQSRYGNFDHK